MGAAFLFAWVFSVTDKSAQGAAERAAFPAQLARSQLDEAQG